MLFGVLGRILERNPNLVGNLFWWTLCKDHDSLVCLLGHSKDFLRSEGEQRQLRRKKYKF